MYTPEGFENVKRMDQHLPNSIKMAVYAYDFNNYLTLDDADLRSDANMEPQNIVYRKSMFEKLSNEAKEVIDIFLNTPAEMITVYGTPSKEMIKYFFLKKGWKHITIKKAFSEVENYVRNVLEA